MALDKQQKQQIMQAIFANNLLNRSMQPLAEAIILGNKCVDVGLQGIQADVSNLVDEMLLYYGHNYDIEEKKLLKEFVAKDLRQFYPHLTIEEIKYGIRQAAHKKYGEVKHFNKFSLDFMNQLLTKYENSEDRKRVLHAYHLQRHETQAQPFTGLSEDDKRRICYESLIKVFEQFKQSARLTCSYHRTITIICLILGHARLTMQVLYSKPGKTCVGLSCAKGRF